MEVMKYVVGIRYRKSKEVTSGKENQRRQEDKKGYKVRSMKGLSLILVLLISLSACGSAGLKEKAEESTTDTVGQQIQTGQVDATTTMETASESSDKMEQKVTISFSESISDEGRYGISLITPPRGETYDMAMEDGFKSAYSAPLSTFSVDVDTAAYANIRRFLNDGQLPPKEAIKIEEMINYFNYDYKSPEDDVPFSIVTEIGPCPWNNESYLAMVGLQGREIDWSQRKKTNLVFLLDISGSMDDPDKLPLLKTAFSMLTEQLGENDRVSIVVYAGGSGIILDGATGEDKELILSSLYRLDAGGSTAGSEGIELAYDLAKKHFVYNGNNRVILATDGDFNVGITDRDDLYDFIERKRDEDIFLTVLGFGKGNTNFSIMETLADHGNGNFAYIDGVKEAEKVLVEELTSSLYTIAKDVKIQVEFNPNFVKDYRLVGYDNRRLENEDFDNDRVDAGDIGAGHRVTAFYEIHLGDANETATLRYQEERETSILNEVMFVKLRYKHPTSDESKLIEQPVNTIKLYDEVSDNYKFAAAVAEFGLLLKDSSYKADADFDHIYETLIDSGSLLKDVEKLEFLHLVGQAESLMP